MNVVMILRVLTWLEGISYLLLLFVAMPLKYIWGVPLATRVAGGVHGILFLGFVIGLYQTHLEESWSKKRSFLLLFAALLPGSVWWLDRRIVRKDIQLKR